VIDCGWFTMEACKLTHTNFLALARGMLGGLSWPVLLLVVEVAVILSVRSMMSPLLLVIAATVAGCLYLLLWGMRTALPLYRNRAELVP